MSNYHDPKDPNQTNAYEFEKSKQAAPTKTSSALPSQIQQLQYLADKAGKIQFSISTGDCEDKINRLIARTKQLAETNGTAKINTQALTTAYQNLNAASVNFANNNTLENQKALIQAEKALEAQTKIVTTSLSRMIATGQSGKSFLQSLKDNSKVFSPWLNTTALITQGIAKIKQAFTELKEVNTILTEIGKTSSLSASQLKNLGDAAFEQAGKYGVKASDYLYDVQKMYQAGYSNAEELAQVSTLAQSAGGLDAELANEYLLASDAAFQYAGNTEKLTSLLDSQNQVTSRNAVSLEELAQATKVAASQLSESGLSENEMTALLGAGIATTKESAETVGRAVRAIIMDLQQIQGETGFDSEVLDGQALEKTEARCRSLGIELKYMQDGMVKLRDPIKILEELSKVYNSLPEGSAEKSAILSDIGGKYRSNVLSSILSNWDKYEKMLKDFENADGSAMDAASKSAENWEGSLNRLSNTWTATVENIANSDTVITIINGLNDVLSIVNQVTDALGPLGTIGLGAGLFAGFKNVGSPKMFGLIIV